VKQLLSWWWWQRLRVAGLCATCGALGWAVGQLGQESPPAPRAVTLQAPTPLLAVHVDPARPFIEVGRDGNVTLRIEQQPLKWVLSEIERQAGTGVVRRDAVQAPRACDAEPPILAAPARDNNDTLRTLRNGTETQRQDALLQAQAEGGVPEAMLKTIYETDASPTLRLMAFEFALQAYDGDATGLTQALETARYLPDAVIAQEANKRLEALAREADTSRRLAQQTGGGP